MHEDGKMRSTTEGPDLVPINKNMYDTLIRPLQLHTLTHTLYHGIAISNPTDNADDVEDIHVNGNQHIALAILMAFSNSISH